MWVSCAMARCIAGAVPTGMRVGEPRELRLCERWTSSAKSVFLFDVQGAVAKSTHAGIPWLKRMRDEAGDKIPFWPFDGWTPGRGQVCDRRGVPADLSQPV